MPTNLSVLEQSTIAGVTIADETLAAVRKLVDENLSAEEFLTRLREVLETYEPLWAKTLSDGMLAAWVEAQIKTIERARLRLTGNVKMIESAGSFGPPAFPPLATVSMPDEPEPVIRYPKIEAAAADLARRNIILPEEYYALDGRAKQLAFTVSKIGTEDALAKIRDALVRDVQEGGTLRQFRRAVNEAAGESALAPHHVENVYRTNIGIASSRGQKAILRHPLVRSEFPYVVWNATHDSRVRPQHLAFERWGIQGTAVYRSDDPLVLAFWPPFYYQCRCKVTTLTLEMAAERYGIKEAIEWLKRGEPPPFPAYVQWPAPEDLPPRFEPPMDLAA